MSSCQSKQLDFIKQLVEIPSVSGNEQQASLFVVEQMKQLGFSKAYVDSAGSAVGFWGSPGGQRIMLVGHIDTVPGEIPCRIENRDGKDVLFGRGSVDAKAPLATFVQAVSQLDVDCSTEFVVVGAVEEELASSKGARQLLEDFPEPNAIIIGEPSNTNGITLGYKGRLVSKVVIRQAGAHSAHQQATVGELAFAWYQAVIEQIEQLNSGKEGAFYPITTALQACNTATDGRFDSAEIVIGFRLGPEFSPVDLQADLEGILDGVKSSDADYQHSINCTEHPAVFDKKNKLARALRVAIRQHQLTPRLLLKTGTSDMNVLSAKWKCPMVAYGPGDSALDHTPDEHLVLEEYLTAIKVLNSALIRL